MVLKLERERARKSKLLEGLLSLVEVKSRLGGTNISEASFDENRVSVDMIFNNGKPPISTVPKRNSDINFKYTSEGEKGTFEFSFPSPKTSKVRSFVFESKYGFHNIVDKIFGTRKYDFLYSPPKTMEDVGLQAPEFLDVSLEYKLPVAVWRALPEEFREHICSFRFNGPILTIAWPKRVECGPAVMEELGVGVDTRNSEMNDNAFEDFKNQLLRTNLVKYQVTEEKSSFTRAGGRFLVDPKNLNYNSIQTLEELTRQKVEGVKSLKPIGEADIKVSGKLSRDSFYEVPALFDRLSGMFSGVGGYVRGENIVIETGKFSTPPTSIVYSDASLEDIGRFMELDVGFSKVSVHSVSKGKADFVLVAKP